MDKFISRDLYLGRIEPFIDKNVIKVLTGQRRVGKSYMLLQLEQMFNQRHPDANVVYISKEYSQFTGIKDNHDLDAYLAGKLVDGAPNYLLIDEVQDIDGFEHSLRSVQAQEQADIYITGSNAKMLSSELATYLAGRYVEIPIHSLSYSEFLKFHNLNKGDESLRAYLTYGGLPYLRNLELSADVAFEYLRNVYSTILLKDVVQREGIRNVDFLETLAHYVAQNVGNLFSANNISRYLKSQRVNIAPIQVINYLHAMHNAYLVHKVQRVDVVGLKKFEIGDKYFFEDLGLRNCYPGFNVGNDIAQLMENAVYQHLAVMGWDVYTGQMSGGREIDFVARHNDNIVYVQVAYRLDSEETRQREFGNLQAISDNYPKYVVSLDSWTTGSNVAGIHHIHLADFLLTQQL